MNNFLHFYSVLGGGGGDNLLLILFNPLQRNDMVVGLFYERETEYQQNIQKKKNLTE